MIDDHDGLLIGKISNDDFEMSAYYENSIMRFNVPFDNMPSDKIINEGLVTLYIVFKNDDYTKKFGDISVGNEFVYSHALDDLSDDGYQTLYWVYKNPINSIHQIDYKNMMFPYVKKIVEEQSHNLVERYQRYIKDECIINIKNRIKGLENELSSLRTILEQKESMI